MLKCVRLRLSFISAFLFFFCFCFNVVEVISNEVPTSITITILSNFTNW